MLSPLQRIFKDTAPERRVARPGVSASVRPSHAPGCPGSPWLWFRQALTRGRTVGPPPFAFFPFTPSPSCPVEKRGMINVPTGRGGRDALLPPRALPVSSHWSSIIAPQGVSGPSLRDEETGASGGECVAAQRQTLTQVLGLPWWSSG